MLAVGEVARRAGVAVSALHFYEQQGLIAAERTAGNQRRYRRHVLRRISLILVAKRIGIPLSEVAEVLAGLPENRMPSKRDWDRISRRWHAHLAARRREIEQLEREITGCIGCGCLSLRRRRVLNPADVLARQGPGPNLLPAAGPDDPPAAAPAPADRTAGEGPRVAR
ncbi:redox-sensitive transcriptional activator SoxR [Streptomyces sp. NPDC059816]|uniref:redox-sensitive transcriptional activator SoxR n=1 Tax=Streptomyces sp. NPDC059816 TaxID=3346960 RepID=UPI003669ECC2